MVVFVERRKMPRVVVAPGTIVLARANLNLEVRLLDLSASSARIGHLALLRPGFPSVLEFPPALALLTLAAHVVRSCIVGTELNPAGERQLRYESALGFVDLTTEQQVILTGILERFSLAGEQLESRCGTSEGRLSLPTEAEMSGLARARLIAMTELVNEPSSQGVTGGRPPAVVRDWTPSGRSR